MSEHGFWVVLGTLSVLLSNAVGTGATALRAIGGTARRVRRGLGHHDRGGWPYRHALGAPPLGRAAFEGVAPSMISFAAGQAGFTLVVIILFNIIEPVGWRVGLTRIEDVAIGCGVSIVVGCFWPRCHGCAGRALSDAFVASSGYLADAVDAPTALRAVGTCLANTRQPPGLPPPRRRLPSIFRRAWRKVVSVDAIANLFTGRTGSGSRRTPWPRSPCGRWGPAGRARPSPSPGRLAGLVRVEPSLVPGVRRLFADRRTPSPPQPPQ